MEENADGKMEFPQDVMLEDCFMDMQEIKYGFITNVTLVNETTCIENVTCTIDGMKINANRMEGREPDQQGLNNVTLYNDLMNDVIDDIMAKTAKSKAIGIHGPFEYINCTTKLKKNIL